MTIIDDAGLGIDPSIQSLLEMGHKAGLSVRECWIRRFIFFHGKRHPAAMAEPEINARTRQQGRHHLDESLVQKAVKNAVAKTGLTKRATCQTSSSSPP